MNADRAVDIGIAIGKRLDRTGVVGTDADAQKMPDTSTPRCLKGCIQGAVVLGEIETIEVTMGIYKHGLKNNYIVWVGRSDLRAPTR
ncbi:hypothetical protein PSA5_04600 [Pseudomonas syringae pv. actinidiae]|nr:hypothetical protein PSA5_04600 [Pseudomonas syringae pv. actinidiae]